MDDKQERRIKELESFCSEVAHEVKAPLNVIYMLAMALKDGIIESDEDRIKTVDLIIEKTKQLSGMTESLLEFSKSADSALKKKKINAQELLLSVFDELKADDPNRDISLIMDEIPDIYGDKNLIYVLFRNILSNSFKFTYRKQSAVITVNAVSNDKCVIISVSDNGVGFDSKRSDKLFKMFSRLHKDNEYDGSGIGLALCAKIIERHEGKISISGEEGKGAQVLLEFPKKQ